MNKKVKYITTTLPYANSKPHIGHAFEFIIGDALSRYFKYVRKDEVLFNIGLDEHGLKIQEAAEKEGVPPQEYVDGLYEVWLDFTKKLKIDSYDNFYRTSDVDHYINVQKFWIELFNKGDIYKKKYKGTYCVGCESFKSDRELEDGKCQDHPTTELKEVEEENYFFRLSNYRQHFLQWLHIKPTFFEPKNKINEFDKIIENLQDISISRVKETVSWGIPVPGDEDQIIYVWFDALLNYIFSAGYYDVEVRSYVQGFEGFWNKGEVVQICGPDNLKFQSVIFQGLLTAAGIKKSDKLLVHGTILDANGRKMSKTVGNVVDPIDQVKKYGIDAVRYYALAGLSTYKNSSWDEDNLVVLHNSHLADDYGNLVARVSHLAGKILEEQREDINVELDYSYVNGDKFAASLHSKIDTVKILWDSYKISEALAETNKIVKSLNKRINDDRPWEGKPTDWCTVLELHYAISLVNDLYYPVIPEKAGLVRRSLRECKKYIIFPKIEKLETV